VFQELQVDGGPVLLEQHELGLHFFEIFVTSRTFPSPQNGAGNAKGNPGKAGTWIFLKSGPKN